MQKVILILSVFLLMLSCSKDDGNNAKTTTVYSMGLSDVDGAGLNDVVTLWTNGVKTQLTDGTNYAAPGSVFVNGDDVYVVGYEVNGAKQVAKLWKNVTKTSLTNGSQHAYANSVFVNGSDVYVVGSEEISIDEPRATLWKNGQKEVL